MEKEMFSEYINEITNKTCDFVCIYDLNFADLMGFPECSKIIREIKHTIKEKYQSKTNFSTIISFSYDNLFFDNIDLELICKEKEEYDESPCELLDITWNNNQNKLSKIKLRIKSISPCFCNFVSIRHSLFIAYYKYLCVTDKEHLFIKFVEYAAKINNANLINEEVFRLCDNIATEKRLLLLKKYNNTIDFFDDFTY